VRRTETESSVGSTKTMLTTRRAVVAVLVLAALGVAVASLPVCRLKRLCSADDLREALEARTSTEDSVRTLLIQVGGTAHSIKLPDRGIELAFPAQRSPPSDATVRLVGHVPGVRSDFFPLVCGPTDLEALVDLGGNGRILQVQVSEERACW
ncbi:MAG: hypothetical protein RIU46_28095, partial [Deltaproteobacteria bacterium]